MSYTSTTIPKEITLTVPEASRVMLAHICNSKGLTPDQAASIILYHACRMLEEAPLQPKVYLAAELDFAKRLRDQTIIRADHLVGAAEKVLLESQGILRGVRNRSLGTGDSV